MQHRQIPPAAIDPRDTACAFRPVDVPDGLASSIGSRGILVPPCVVPAGDGYRILYGYRRVAAARTAGTGSIPVVVCPADASGRTRAELIAADNAGHRMCMADTAGLAALLVRLAGLDARACDKAFLSAARGCRFADLAGVAALPAPLLDANRAGTLTDETLMHLLVVDRQVLPLVTGLILRDGLRFSRGDLRRAGQLFKELGALQGGDPGAVLGQDEWEGVRDAALTPKQRTERLLMLLQERRFPQLEGCRASLRAAVGGVQAGAPGRVTVQGHPYFEHQRLQFSFTAADTRELAAYLAHLRQRIDDGSCDRLFRAAAAGEPGDAD